MRLSHYYPAVNTNISPIVFTSHLASICLVYNEIAQAPPSNVFSTSVISTGSTGLSQSFHIPQCIQSTHNSLSQSFHIPQCIQSTHNRMYLDTTH